ncbi:cysteine desulfurase family protein, VC1184 subfamily [Raineyella antarctica]|uniref:Cysteine desulfurase family protein, VC1184 subfamily n=1 Tax=Raineyella antarctica TaxID=1577474 RepID=A0A1G6HI27_9ACTN|nr:cysteine desulfurase-like protein [Raineyella antarctica]SDB93595.1 cysteine desulfurase family protein, VC1184 subfamily [Raineyella antarctica]
MSYDVDAVRQHFPALRSGTAHFDGPGGSQTPAVVAEAVARTLTSSIANRGTVTAAERLAEQTVVAARAAMGDLLGTDPDTVIFGRSMTANTMELARTLARCHGWGPADEVVVSSLDHDANIRPWVLAAEAVGATVRWAHVDPDTAELPLDAVTEVLSERTRLVAVTAASNLVGTRPDLHGIIAAAHAAGALVHVDAVHLAAHASVDREQLGADLVSCSPYKFFGPHLGVTAGRAELLEQLRPDKLLPSTDRVPERFELGTLPYELLAGTTAAVDFLAGLAGVAGMAEPADAAGNRATGPLPRRRRLLASYAAIEEHEDRLRAQAEAGLRGIDGITVHSRAVRRTPTLLFTLDGVDPQVVYRLLATRGINAPASHFYAWECSHRLGLGAAGGVRVGMAPYTTAEEVDRLLEGVAEVAAARWVARDGGRRTAGRTAPRHALDFVLRKT